MSLKSLLLIFFATAVYGVEYTLPAMWTGTTTGSVDGNPVLVAGKPLWRIDQVWPADPTEGSNYVPMIWTGTDWGVKENGFGGQPGATTAAGAVTLGIRGPWDGAAAARIAALVFIAPTTGSYQVVGVLDVSRWSGDQPISVHVYRRDPTKKTVRPIADIKVDIKADNPLTATTSLNAGDELLVIAEIGSFHTAGSVLIRNLVITAP